ncbi:MAG: hypothetical protein ACI4II_06355 [Acutalibacteraceae bacterium]
MSDKVFKSVTLKAMTDLPDSDLALINNLSLGTLTKDDIYTFKAVLCDNALDRDFEKFSIKALSGLSEFFKNRTVIKDHVAIADNQIARIYKTDLSTDEALKCVDGEPYTQLIAYCYMVKTKSNSDLIAEINAGIKKEGSVSCAISKRTCSICGKDTISKTCTHISGREYDGKKCYKILDEPVDAYEFSLVAVPAQKCAGVSKSFNDEISILQLKIEIIKLKRRH